MANKSYSQLFYHVDQTLEFNLLPSKALQGEQQTSCFGGGTSVSYRPFLSTKSSFVNFLFSSKMTLLLYIHIVIIAGDLLKARKKPVQRTIE